MNKNIAPLCSIVILNYFGERVIKNVVSSLLQLNYPKNRFEIIIVDNASTDKSLEILAALEKQISNLRVIKNKKNEGFSKGNNIGIREARGEYVVILNNDCVVTKDWLKEIVKTAEKDKKIFAVGSKTLLYPGYLNLNFEINPYLIPMYGWLTNSNLVKILDSKMSIPLVNNKITFSAEIPYDKYFDSTIDISIFFNYRGKNKVKNKTYFEEQIKLPKGPVKIKDIIISEDDIELILQISLKNDLYRTISVDKVQNAGIIVFQDGYGRDIGASVKLGQQTFELDHGQFNEEKEVYAACGVALLFRKSILDKIGLLDESFFMYYEDVEISERARFLGYKIFYSPKAVVRHFHAMSSEEWSPFFLYNAERGRLLHVFYNFPFNIFIYEYLLIVLKLAINSAILIKRLKGILRQMRSRGKRTQKPQYLMRFQLTKVLFYFLIHSPILFISRINKSFNRPRNAVMKNYKSILEGKWYS